jgi:predicted phage replisome organizer
MPKRYYWLKLKENFFEEETIKLIENMENGKDYVIFLLKLRLKAMNSDGRLYFKDLMPYNEKMLSTITNTNIDIVKAALATFRQVGLVSLEDDGTIYVEQMQELIGSEVASAERVRKHRAKLQQLETKALPGNSEVTKSNIDIEIEKEIEKESTKKLPKKTKYAEYVSMFPEQYDKLVSGHGEKAAMRMIELLDNYKGSVGKRYKDDYRAILSWVANKYYEEKDKQPPGIVKKPPVDPEQRKRIAELNAELAAQKTAWRDE